MIRKALLFFLLCNLAYGKNSHLSRLSIAGGDMRSMFIRGNYAYTGEGYRLVIFDISDITQPKRITEYLCDNIVEDIDIMGSIACVACTPQKDLMLMNIADPYHPIKLSELNIDWGGKAVKMFDHYVLLCRDGGNPNIYDISDPYHPVLISTITTGTPYDATLNGHTAYFTNQDIYDLTNPAQPVKVGTIPYPEGFWFLRTQGNYLYGTDDGVMKVFDISKPLSPVAVGTFNGNSGARIKGITIDGNRAYLADEDYGIYTVDITDPANPSRIELTPPRWINKLGITESGVLYSCGRTSGLTFYDNHTSGLPILGRTPVMGNPTMVTCEFPYLYVANHTAGIATVKINDPEHPKLVGNYPSFDSVYDLVWKDNILFSVGTHQFKILNASDPTSLTLLSTLAIPDNYGNFLKVYDNTAFLSESSLYAIDVTTLTQPRIRSHIKCPNGQFLKSVAFTHNEGNQQIADYLYLTDEGGFLQTVDVRNPDNLQIVDTYDNGGYALGMELTRTTDTALLYINKFNTVNIYDLTDPRHPLLTKSLQTNGGDGIINISRGYLYANLQNLGLGVYDLSTTGTPPIVAQYLPTSIAFYGAVHGSVVYQSEFQGGIELFRLSGIRDLDAEILRENTPPELVLGSTAPVQITVRNYGKLAWIATAPVFLEATFSGNNNDSITQLVQLNPTTTIPLETDYTFNFDLQAPEKPGKYKLNLQLAQLPSLTFKNNQLNKQLIFSNLEPFGQEYTLNVDVQSPSNNVINWLDYK